MEIQTKIHTWNALIISGFARLEIYSLISRVLQPKDQLNIETILSMKEKSVDGVRDSTKNYLLPDLMKRVTYRVGDTNLSTSKAMMTSK